MRDVDFALIFYLFFLSYRGKFIQNQFSTEMINNEDEGQVLLKPNS